MRVDLNLSEDPCKVEAETAMGRDGVGGRASKSGGDDAQGEEKLSVLE